MRIREKTLSQISSSSLNLKVSIGVLTDATTSNIRELKKKAIGVW